MSIDISGIMAMRSSIIDQNRALQRAAAAGQGGAEAPGGVTGFGAGTGLGTTTGGKGSTGPTSVLEVTGFGPSTGCSTACAVTNAGVNSNSKKLAELRV